jgi:uncharacterized membrane protein YdjX (TVP38/TMEM64 family)
MARNTSSVRFQHIMSDMGIIVLSILLAYVLVQANVIDGALAASREYGHIGAFLAGIFFTSLFTTAPAIAAIAEVAQRLGPAETALWGALGAVIGDMIIFRFVRDRMADHVVELLAHRRGAHRFQKLLKYRFFRYGTFLLGGIIIASPLPDELGISLLGLSRMREMYFVPLSFAFNFAGILAISLIAVSAA